MHVHTHMQAHKQHAKAHPHSHMQKRARKQVHTPVCEHTTSTKPIHKHKHNTHHALTANRVPDTGASGSVFRFVYTSKVQFVTATEAPSMSGSIR